MLRRSTLWGAVCIFALAMPAGAQVQTTVTSATPAGRMEQGAPVVLKKGVADWSRQTSATESV